MLQSLSSPTTLPSHDQQDMCLNFSPLRDFRSVGDFDQPLRPNIQDRCRIKPQICRSDYGSIRLASEAFDKDDENSEKPQKQDLYAVRLLEKLLKEKNSQIENEQNTKKALQSNSTTILGERSLNVSLDRKEESEPKPMSDLQQKFKQITVPPRRPVQRSRDENNPTIVPIVPKKEPVNRALNLKKLEKCPINQILYISRTRMDFGYQMPGQIVNESLDIVNKTNQDLVVQIFLDCETPEFKDLDEYVYSIRRSNCYEYNDRHFLIMTPYSSASFKVGLKVPNAKKECINKGYAEISVQGLKNTQRIELESKIVIPKVVCPKALYHREAQCEIINLAVQEGKRNDFKLPLRNKGTVPVEIDFYFHNNHIETTDNTLDCYVSPQTLTIDAEGAAVLNFCARGNRKELKENKKGEKRYVKKVLMGKVKGTNITYSFLFLMQVY